MGTDVVNSIISFGMYESPCGNEMGKKYWHDHGALPWWVYIPKAFIVIPNFTIQLTDTSQNLGGWTKYNMRLFAFDGLENWTRVMFLIQNSKVLKIIIPIRRMMMINYCYFFYNRGPLNLLKNKRRGIFLWLSGN